MLILPASLPDSNLLARVTLWPNRQYRGILIPTTPARTEPEWIPIRIYNEINCLKFKLNNFSNRLEALKYWLLQAFEIKTEFLVSLLEFINNSGVPSFNRTGLNVDLFSITTELLETTLFHIGYSSAPVILS